MLTTIAEPKTWIEPLLLFREKLSKLPGRPAEDPADGPDSKTGKAVLCRTCRAVVTGRDREISVNGKHLHTFFNPAGIVYEIRCFSAAPGCINHGRPTDEFTWFTGHTWEYSLCATCFDHLGWFYTSSGPSFFGLINSKLIVE